MMNRDFIRSLAWAPALVALALVSFDASAQSCPSGQTPCGTGCMPSGADCCDGQGYCAGSNPVCCGGGTCGPSSSACNGGGSCDAGQTACGDGCMPAGASCCDGEAYCDASNPVCCGDGTCGVTSSDCSGGSGGPSGPSGPGGSSSGYQCASANGLTNECPSVDACCNTNDCYYEADGKRFECNGTFCQSAAEDLVEYCEGAYGGCSIGRGATVAPLGVFGVFFLAAWGRRIRRRMAKR